MNCSNEKRRVESTYCEGGAGSRIERLLRNFQTSEIVFLKTLKHHHKLWSKCKTMSRSTSRDALFYSALDSQVYDGVQASSNLHSGLDLIYGGLASSSNKTVVIVSQMVRAM